MGRKQKNPKQRNLTTVQIKTCWKCSKSREKVTSPLKRSLNHTDARGSPQFKKKTTYKRKKFFNLLHDWQQTVLNVKSSSGANQWSPCPACDDWGGGRGTQSSLRTLSAALFVPFWQPHLNIRTRSSAVLKHVSNAALSKTDSQCSSSTFPNAHKVIFDLQM